MAQATLHRVLQGHQGTVNSVAFSPYSELIASASDDCTVRLWNISNGELNAELKGHTKTVRSVAFSPDGQSIVTGSGDKTVRIWSVRDKQQIKTLGFGWFFSGHSDEVCSVAWSPKRSFSVASGSFGKTLSRNDAVIASGSFDKTVILWDVISSSARKTLTGHTDSVVSVSFSQNGNLLASAGDADNTAIIWDVNSGAALIKSAQSSAVWSVCFSPNDQFVITGCKDKIVRMCNASNGREEKRFEGHTNPVHSVACSFNGSKIASGSDDNSVRLWDVASTNQLQQLDGHSNYVWSVSFSRDGKFIASGSQDKTVRLWNVPAFLKPPIQFTPQRTEAAPSASDLRPRQIVFFDYPQQTVPSLVDKMRILDPGQRTAVPKAHPSVTDPSPQGRNRDFRRDDHPTRDARRERPTRDDRLERPNRHDRRDRSFVGEQTPATSVLSPNSSSRASGKPLPARTALSTAATTTTSTSSTSKNYEVEVVKRREGRRRRRAEIDAFAPATTYSTEKHDEGEMLSKQFLRRLPTLDSAATTTTTTLTTPPSKLEEQETADPELEQKLRELEDQKKEIDKQKEDLRTKQQDIEKNQKEIAQQKAELEEQKKEMEKQQQEISDQLQEIAQKKQIDEEAKKSKSNLDLTKFRDWSINEVCLYLEEAGVDDEVVQIFQKHKIRGISLAGKANDDVLKSMGIDIIGDREYVIHKINKLVSSTSTANTVFKVHEIPRAELTKDTKLNEGNFGIVWRGTYTGIPVAIKEPKLYGAELNPKKQLADLIEESTVMASVFAHPNVLHCYGISLVGEDDYWLVTELCNLGSLDAFLKAYPGTPAVDRRRFSQQVARGLNHLGKHNVTHRDVAARNVLLHDQGSGVIVAKVCDFGLSRQREGEYVLLGENVVSIQTAPEVFITGKHSSRSDVWSFGVLLWEVESLCATLARPDSQAFPPLSKPARASNKIYDIMLKCWAIDPHQRPSFEVLVDLFKSF